MVVDLPLVMAAKKVLSRVFFFCPSMTELKTDIERRNRKAQPLVCFLVCPVRINCTKVILNRHCENILNGLKFLRIKYRSKIATR